MSANAHHPELHQDEFLRAAPPMRQSQLLFEQAERHFPLPSASLEVSDIPQRKHRRITARGERDSDSDAVSQPHHAHQMASLLLASPQADQGIELLAVPREDVGKARGGVLSVTAPPPEVSVGSRLEERDAERPEGKEQQAGCRASLEEVEHIHPPLGVNVLAPRSP